MAQSRTHAVSGMAGRHRSTGRKAWRQRWPLRVVSSPITLGIAAVTVSIGGTVNSAALAPTGAQMRTLQPPSAMDGQSRTSTSEATEARSTPVSRSASRTDEAAVDKNLVEVAERQVRVRTATLDRMTQRAGSYAAWLEATRWTPPLDQVAITAEFGDYGLWSSSHTGIDFNGDTGDSIMAIAGGQVTNAGYDGAYGYKTVVTLADGTEIWYCHQDSIGVNVGDSVAAGQVIGTVGSTGNVTGSHLHLEVRPGGGDPVDPREAFLARGITL